LKRHIGKKDKEDDDHNELALEVVKMSKSKQNDNDRVTDQLTGIHSGSNTAQAAIARWLMEAKKTYGRPVIDPRANGFKMKHSSSADTEKYGNDFSHDPAQSILKRQSAPYSDSTRSDSLSPNQEVQTSVPGTAVLAQNLNKKVIKVNKKNKSV